LLLIVTQPLQTRGLRALLAMMPTDYKRALAELRELAEREQAEARENEKNEKVPATKSG